MLIFLCQEKKSLVEDQDISDKIIILGDIYCQEQLCGRARV